MDTIKKFEDIAATRRPAQGLLRNERGIVLVVTMGMMSLLMVLVSSFTFKALMTLRNVKEAENNIRNRLLDESSQYDIQALIGGEFADINDARNLFPATKPSTQVYGPTFTSSDSPWGGRIYMASGFLDLGISPPTYTTRSPAADQSDTDRVFHVQIASQNYTPESAFSLDASDTLGWVHIYDQSDSYTDNDTPITSRFIYLVIDDSGKVKPEFICSTETAEGSEVRIGRHVSEISLRDIISDSDLATKLQSTSHTGGEMNSNSGWFSYYDIFKTMASNTADFWDTDSRKYEVLDNLFPHSSEVEAWFNGEHDKHRFDIERTSITVPNGWNTLTTDSDILQAAAKYWNQDSYGDDDTDSASSDTNGGIDYFKNGYDSAVAAQATDTQVQIKQVAANLIDFFDDDSDLAASTETVHAATTDWDSSTWSNAGTSYPTYCGNEEVPYINEIRFQVNYELGVATLMGEVELFYMYGDENDNTTGFDKTGLVLDVNCTLEASGVGATLVAISATADDIAPEDFDAVHAASPNGTTSTTILPHSYPTTGMLELTIGGATLGTIDVTASPTNLSSLAITIKHAVLKDSNGNLWDFAFDGVTTSPATTLDGTVAGGGSTSYISIEVNDPRNNQRTSEWTWGAWTDAPNSNGTMGSKNSASVLTHTAGGASQDAETAIEPCDISTAYIANTPAASPWALGAVHRGATWQTLNLSTYDTTVTINSMPSFGFGRYEAGDAHLLNEIKLGVQTKTSGRININTYNENVLTGLLSRVTVGGDYDNPGGGTAITDVGTLVTAIKAANGSAGGVPFRFRGQLASVSAMSAGVAGGGIAQATDAAKEEIICKVVNLTSVRQNYFTVIMTSQVIQDMISDYRGGKRGVFDSGVDQILAEQRVMAVMSRDPITNEIEVVSYEYIE